MPTPAHAGFESQSALPQRLVVGFRAAILNSPRQREISASDKDGSAVDDRGIDEAFLRLGVRAPPVTSVVLPCAGSTVRLAWRFMVRRPRKTFAQTDVALKATGRRVRAGWLITGHGRCVNPLTRPASRSVMCGAIQSPHVEGLPRPLIRFYDKTAR